jgi:broad specificity phosphatase PhoE
MNKILILVRHGQSEKAEHLMSEDNYTLTLLGRTGMRYAGNMLRDMPRITSLYTSPLLRAKESADIISKPLILIPRVEPLLTDLGTSESWISIQNRMREFAERESIERISLGGGITVAVTHNYPITSIVGHFLNVDERTMRTVEVAPCSFTVIDFGKSGSAAILAVGNTTITESKLGEYWTR